MMKWRDLVLAAVCLAALPAWSANPAFQNFLFAACATPTGALATRCAETIGGLGNVSTDSESSLNPSQVLSGGDGGLAAARAASDQARDRAERARSGETAENELAIGPFSLLLNGHGTFEDRDRRVDLDAERGYERDAWGAELGFDYRVSDTFVIGAMLAWEQSDTQFDRENPGVNFTPQSNAGEIDSDRIGLIGFASIEVFPQSNLEVSLGWLRAEHEFSRYSVFQESQRTTPQTNVRASADADGLDTFAAAHWSYLHEQAGWSFAPYLGLLYSRSEVDSYREQDRNGSGLALAVDDYERESLLGSVGVQIGRGISLTSGLLLPQLRIEYAHEFDRDAQRAVTAFQLDAGNNVYALEGDDPDRDYFNVGAGVAFVLPNGWLPFIDYQRMLGYDDLDQWRITAGLRREL